MNTQLFIDESSASEAIGLQRPEEKSVSLFDVAEQEIARGSSIWHEGHTGAHLAGSQTQVPSSAVTISGGLRRNLDAIDWENPALMRLDRRHFIEAVLIVSLQMGCWNRVPARYGNYHAIYMRFTRWVEKGAWRPVIAALEGTEWSHPLQALVRKQEFSIERRKVLRAVRQQARESSAAAPVDTSTA